MVREKELYDSILKIPKKKKKIKKLFFCENFCEEILQAAAILDKKLKLSICICFNFNNSLA